MIVIDYQTASDLTPFPELVHTLKQAFTKSITVPLRHNHSIESGEEKGILLLMPAWDQERFMGLKTVHIYANNRQKNLPGLHSTYLLFDSQTGQLLANIDGNAITSKRTAAASALAADYLARKDATRLLIVGSGQVAAYLADAYAAVRPIAEVVVWNINPESAQRLVDELQQKGYQASLATDLKTAVQQADIISCATLSETPLIQGDWLQAGQHLDLIGSFTPAMIEADPSCFAGNSVFVDTDEAAMKAGDLLEAFKANTLTKEQIQATLFDLCEQRHPGRKNETEITVFKAVGNALEDLATAALIYQKHQQ